MEIETMIFGAILMGFYVLAGVGVMTLMRAVGPIPRVVGIVWPLMLIIIAFIGTPFDERNNQSTQGSL